MKHSRWLWPALLAASFGAGAAETPVLTGFGPDGAAAESALEQRFDQQLDPAELRALLKQMSSAPNNVGTAKDKENAEFTLGKFKEWGWDAHIETFYMLYPTPKSHLLELLGPTPFKAALHEQTLAEDATSSQNDAGLPPYNVFGADGDVTAELVYVNYGMPDDYKELARRGIDVKGKIVIARYGAGWRGLKPKLAYEHGAVGCLIYSDPKGDGYYQGDVYPKGGWRPADGVQRGSVLDMPVYPGDPLTPGVAATKDAKRLSIADAKTILKIPVMPISYADAQPLLQALDGPVAEESWRGAMPFTYHLGPGPAKVHLAIQSEWGLKPIYDVIATIPGSEEPDQWVVRGNHHDGWTFGAWDPLSGNIDLMEEAKAIGGLLKTGWRPKRTLVYASWDAEEPGLIGSTEWVEAHAEELQRKAVVYINSDENARGFLEAGGSHSLQRLVNEVAAGIKDPETGASVQQRLRARLEVDGYEQKNDKEKVALAKAAASGGDVPIAALGSGSDFTPFLQHLGIATLALSYTGEADQDGVYHSDYDSFDHYERFGDPDFAYGIAEAQTVGHVTLRMANADVLPLQFGDFADTIERYVGEVRRLADEQRERAQLLDKMLDQDAYHLVSDPTRPVGPPERQPQVPFLNLAPLDNAVARLKASAKTYDEACAAALRGGSPIDAHQRRALNALLQGAEQALIDARGLPGRDWFRHMIYAPGLYTGYGVKTLPGVREAIEQKHFEQADQYAAMIAQALDAYADRIDHATALLARQ